MGSEIDYNLLVHVEPLRVMVLALSNQSDFSHESESFNEVTEDVLSV